MLKSLHRFWLLTFMAMTGALPATALAAPSPSFSCSQHMSPDEQAICKNPQLTALDHIANQGYLFLREKLGKAQANKINLPLIRQRQKCKADIVCIEKAQRESIRVFNQNGAKLEIPDAAPETAMKSEAGAALNAPVATAEPAPPVEAPAKPEATTPSSDAATTPAPKTPALKESSPTENPATTTTAEAENPAEKPAGGAEELLDQPPVESDPSTAANDNSTSQNSAAAVADARPNASGSREWRSDIEKEIRAESELESTATDVLEKEMAEQAKPITRQERQAVEKHKSKHRMAFILAAILFALVVGYAISKLRHDPGVIPPAAKRTPAQASESTTASVPLSPPRLATLPPSVSETGSVSRSGAKTTPDAPTLPTPVKPLPPKAWVWSQYRGRV